MKTKKTKRPGTTLVRIRAVQLQRLRALKRETGLSMRELAERALEAYLSKPGA
jgi:hypothetical protein